jgi:hypothetical protein
MKTKKAKKLVLTKSTVAHLENAKMGVVNGGTGLPIITDDKSECPHLCPLTDYTANPLNCPQWITYDETCQCHTNYQTCTCPG